MKNDKDKKMQMRFETDIKCYVYWNRHIFNNNVLICMTKHGSKDFCKD